MLLIWQSLLLIWLAMSAIPFTLTLAHAATWPMSFQNAIYPLISGIQVLWQYLPAEIVAKVIPQMRFYCLVAQCLWSPSWEHRQSAVFSYIYHSDLSLTFWHYPLSNYSHV